MKTKLLLFFALVFGIGADAQCGPTLPPPGYATPAYGLDTDNDGYAIFDIAYYIEYIDRPRLESFFGISSAAYNATFRSQFAVQPLLYTNTVQNQECSIEYVYSGSGPQFEEQPPCYFPVHIYLGTGFLLITVPHDGDEDNDGILNSDEDTNHNLNLMDDDEDSDGIINLKDALNNLASVNYTTLKLNVYPNPVTNGVLSFESTDSILAVSIYDMTGKKLSENRISASNLNVSALSSGIYFLKFQSENGFVYKKIVVSN